MNIALVDLPDQRIKLFPFTLTRPVSHLRVGILTIREKWERMLGQQVDALSTTQLNTKFQQGPSPYDLVINATIFPNDDLISEIQKLTAGQVLQTSPGFVAAKGNFLSIEDLEDLSSFDSVQTEIAFTSITRSWDMFLQNSEQIEQDFKSLTANRVSEEIEDPHTIVYNPENVFLEEGVKIKAAILNAETGPIYLAKGSEIQEGATIRGPFYLGENSRINMNAKIREGSSIGANCKVGGELSNSILMGNSNKAHGGFLGNSVIGEFCNLGAATNNSNLKNNYTTVKMWDYLNETFIDTGLQFCGLMMGDHSKSAIGTTFNTGTSVGLSCNIFSSTFPQKFLPSFTWGGAEKLVTYAFERALETAEKSMNRKGEELTKEDQDLLKTVFENSAKYRL